MGPSHARDQKPGEDDRRVATLEASLEAYSARASTAHTRLLKTIDVLDALRSQHALEIAAEEKEKMKLAHELGRLRTVTKKLEVEKDELKDVVEDLINKVGCTSLSMQGGNLNVKFPEEVIARSVDAGGTTEADYNNDLLAYATSIIARLRTELDFERNSHKRTVEEANLRIEELEAKVAVREAELESFIVSPDQERHTPPSSAKRKPGKTLAQPKTLSDEECLRFLESNNARNRSLEIEIRHLAEKLEKTRLAAATLGSSLNEPRSPASRDGTQSTGLRARSSSVDPSAMSRPGSDVTKAASALRSASPSTVLSIAQLDGQIREMNTHVDALVSERTTLIEAAARQQRAMNKMHMGAFQDVLRVEGECVRLQSEVDDLRDQLRRARDRENALVRELAQRGTSSGYRPLEDDIAIEESVELGSPLVPNVVPSAHSHLHNVRAETVDLDLMSFSRHASPPSTQDVGRIQAALDVARADLAQKEEGLAQLRAEMENMRDLRVNI